MGERLVSLFLEIPRWWFNWIFSLFRLVLHDLASGMSVSLQKVFAPKIRRPIICGRSKIYWLETLSIVQSLSVLYRNPRVLHIGDTCLDTSLGSPLAGHFNGLWLFLLICKCLEEKESGFCRGRVITWKAHQEGRFLSQSRGGQLWLTFPGWSILVTQIQEQQN